MTFGNLPELLIAFFALQAGLHEVVKASIIGSVMGNACSSSAGRCWSAA